MKNIKNTAATSDKKKPFYYLPDLNNQVCMYKAQLFISLLRTFIGTPFKGSTSLNNSHFQKFAHAGMYLFIATSQVAINRQIDT